MASVEKIQGAVAAAREKFVKAGEKVEARSKHTAASVSALKGLLAALEGPGAVHKGMVMGKEHLKEAVQASGKAEECADHGLRDLRGITAGATSEPAQKMVGAAAKTHGDLFEGRARLESASEGFDELSGPIEALKKVALGILGQLDPEYGDGEEAVILHEDIVATDKAIEQYNNSL